jgi:pyruvate dehydrogenase E2 component (dihydrolipoamide acetyltransferase)
MMENNIANKGVSGDKVIKKILPLTGIRKVTALTMEESLRRSPQATAFIQVDMTNLIDLKNKFKEQDLKISFTEMFIKIVAHLLEEHPLMNAARIEKKIELYESINIGFGVSAPDYSLIVPVIKNANKKDMFKISAEVKEKIQKVNDGTLTMEDVADGTSTISSLGMFDVDGFTPILNPPQSSLLAIGTTRKVPVVDEEGNIVVRPMAYFSSTIDHAVVNGVPHCNFLKALRDAVTNPAKYINL